ncbi:MAG: DsbA family protein [Marivibrio sp.]|uniref:DsbA family protein n=1 Tax=Marivibrio sp. TaxID=2039719 RepID=UPI0032EECE99
MPLRRPLPRLFGALALVATLAAPAAGPAVAQQPGGLSDAERTEIETLVRDYILNNPEIILEAVNRLQARQEAEEQARRQAALAQNADKLYADPRAPTHGPGDASITLVEFFDYQCGYCKQILPDMVKLAESREDLKIVFKEFPILGPMSEVAARAALAAERQGAYFAYHRAVMGMRGQLTEQKLYDEAAALGLDVERLKADMGDPDIAAYLESNRQLAQQIGVTGTPALIVGDALIPGAISYERMVQLIEAEEARREAEKDG